MLWRESDLVGMLEFGCGKSSRCLASSCTGGAGFLRLYFLQISNCGVIDVGARFLEFIYIWVEV